MVLRFARGSSAIIVSDLGNNNSAILIVIKLVAGLDLTGSNYKKVVPLKKRRQKMQSRKMKKTNSAAMSKLNANSQKTRK